MSTCSAESLDPHIDDAALAAFKVEANREEETLILDRQAVTLDKAGAGKLLFLEEPFTYEPLAFGLKKGDYDSLNWINNWLNQIRHDGTYDRIHDKWFKKNDWLKEME